MTSYVNGFLQDSIYTGARIASIESPTFMTHIGDTAGRWTVVEIVWEENSAAGAVFSIYATKDDAKYLWKTVIIRDVTVEHEPQIKGRIDD